jgi:hypothetical protein
VKILECQTYTRRRGEKIRQLFSNAVIKNEYTGCIIDIFEKCIMDKY